MSELKLALRDAITGAPAYMHHMISVEHAELLLPGRETLYPEWEGQS